MKYATGAKILDERTKFREGREFAYIDEPQCVALATDRAYNERAIITKAELRLKVQQLLVAQSRSQLTADMGLRASNILMANKKFKNSIFADTAEALNRDQSNAAVLKLLQEIAENAPLH